MKIREYIIEKLAQWLEPVFDRIIEKRDAATVAVAKDTFKSANEAAERTKVQVDAYKIKKSTRNKVTKS